MKVDEIKISLRGKEARIVEDALIRYGYGKDTLSDDARKIAKDLYHILYELTDYMYFNSEE